MAEKLVPVYRGFTVDDVQRLADYLEERGVESYVDSTQSPMYGMNQGAAAHVLYVDSHIVGYTRQIVRQFIREWHGPVPKDETENEQSAYEIPTPDRPSDDALSDSPQDQDHPYGPGIDDAERPGRESPEVEDLIDEAGHEDFDHRIVGFGTDRGISEEDASDEADFEDQPDVDEADSRQGLDEEESRSSESDDRS